MILLVILSRLPHDVRTEWPREEFGHESDTSWLIKFLQQEWQRREPSEPFGGTEGRRPPTKTVSAL